MELPSDAEDALDSSRSSGVRYSISISESPRASATRLTADSSSHSPRVSSTRSRDDSSSHSPRVSSTRLTADSSSYSPRVSSTRLTADSSSYSPRVSSTRLTADGSSYSPRVSSTRLTADGSERGPAERPRRHSSKRLTPDLFRRSLAKHNRSSSFEPSTALHTDDSRVTDMSSTLKSPFVNDMSSTLKSPFVTDMGSTLKKSSAAYVSIEPASPEKCVSAVPPSPERQLTGLSSALGPSASSSSKESLDKGRSGVKGDLMSPVLQAPCVHSRERRSKSADSRNRPSNPRPSPQPAAQSRSSQASRKRLDRRQRAAAPVTSHRLQHPPYRSRSRSSQPPKARHKSVHVKVRVKVGSSSPSPRASPTHLAPDVSSRPVAERTPPNPSPRPQTSRRRDSSAAHPVAERTPPSSSPRPQTSRRRGSSAARPVAGRTPPNSSPRPQTSRRRDSSAGGVSPSSSPSLSTLQEVTSSIPNEDVNPLRVPNDDPNFKRIAEFCNELEKRSGRALPASLARSPNDRRDNKPTFGELIAFCLSKVAEERKLNALADVLVAENAVPPPSYPPPEAPNGRPRRSKSRSSRGRADIPNNLSSGQPIPRRMNQSPQELKRKLAEHMKGQSSSMPQSSRHKPPRRSAEALAERGRTQRPARNVTFATTPDLTLDSMGATIKIPTQRPRVVNSESPSGTSNNLSSNEPRARRMKQSPQVKRMKLDEHMKRQASSMPQSSRRKSPHRSAERRGEHGHPRRKDRNDSSQSTRFRGPTDRTVSFADLPPDVMDATIKTPTQRHRVVNTEYPSGTSNKLSSNEPVARRVKQSPQVKKMKLDEHMKRQSASMPQSSSRTPSHAHRSARRGGEHGRAQRRGRDDSNLPSDAVNVTMKKTPETKRDAPPSAGLHRRKISSVRKRFWPRTSRSAMKHNDEADIKADISSLPGGMDLGQVEVRFNQRTGSQRLKLADDSYNKVTLNTEAIASLARGVDPTEAIASLPDDVDLPSVNVGIADDSYNGPTVKSGAASPLDSVEDLRNVKVRFNPRTGSQKWKYADDSYNEATIKKGKIDLQRLRGRK